MYVCEILDLFFIDRSTAETPRCIEWYRVVIRVKTDS